MKKINDTKWILARYLKGTLSRYLSECYLKTAGFSGADIEKIFTYSYVTDSLGLKCHSDRRAAVLFAFKHRKAARVAFGAKHKKLWYTIHPACK